MAGYSKRYIAILPDGCNVRQCQGIKVEVTEFLNKYLIKNQHTDDTSSILQAKRAQKQFDERAFLEFKNHIDLEFSNQENLFKLMIKPTVQFKRHTSQYEEDNKLMLYTPEGTLIKGFSEIEGIYNSSDANLGFLVASWTGYFMGMEGYDPDLGHSFKKSIKERQVRDNIDKLEAEWKYKRNEFSHSNQEYSTSPKLKNINPAETNYIWRNESYRHRFITKLGEMKPPHMHDTTSEEHESPIRQKSPVRKNLILEKSKLQSKKRGVNKGKISNNKSHAMMVQATAKDLLNFDSVCLLSEKYKFDNKLIYEIHSEFISIRDLQK